ncbi:DEAD/DEAH box helicase [Bacillus sp. SM2101]|uniref:DEAD/DEAH box helicase n=1 Tax=Bacillus sp. SM2101 TaxID=2805366 RepID=UPI001BDF6AD1|nr:DEAD/DEAH box helicase [Bacillus sp. SM2101]
MRFYEYRERLIPESLATSELEKHHLQKKPLGQCSFMSPPTCNSSYVYSKQLQQYLFGKQLLLHDIPYPLDLIHEHYVNGYLTYQQGIAFKHGNYYCKRCGNRNKQLFSSFLCARCHEKCTYCRKCIMLGRISECTPVIHWIGPSPDSPRNDGSLQWDGTLSKSQKLASTTIKETIDQHSTLLVWAVCGSGKTEVLFSGIERALQTNKYICIATPRTDVVLELAPRLREVFPSININALYGGSADLKNKLEPLTLSTTHQLLRYYRAFDVVIIDEVDAFPYTVEPMLRYAVNNAKKLTASTIYLTATPHSQWQREVKRQQRNAIVIPARYHGYPLPLPSFRWCGNWQKCLLKHYLPTIVTSWLSMHLQCKKQALLFVPSIDVLHTITMIIKKFDQRIDSVSSKDPKRKEKVAAFRKGDIQILVTTTILERGVTIPNIDVAVLGAEDRIFTESALVQISGRVGRHAASPTGEIIFFHFGKTKAMVRAKRHIQYMNKQGQRQGYINNK